MGELSDRETQVLGLIAGGLSNKHIARELDISENTVKHHITSILRKLPAGNRAAAAAEWVRRTGT